MSTQITWAWVYFYLFFPSFLPHNLTPSNFTLLTDPSPNIATIRTSSPTRQTAPLLTKLLADSLHTRKLLGSLARWSSSPSLLVASFSGPLGSPAQPPLPIRCSLPQVSLTLVYCFFFIYLPNVKGLSKKFLHLPSNVTSCSVCYLAKRYV